MHLLQGCLFHLDQQVNIRVDSVSPKYQIYFVSLPVRATVPETVRLAGIRR